MCLNADSDFIRLEGLRIHLSKKGSGMPMRLIWPFLSSGNRVTSQFDSEETAGQRERCDRPR